jgi:signal transduction histidine kinase
MKNNPLHLAESHILIEQLRLILGNASSSASHAILLVLLLFFALSDGSNTVLIGIWCVAVMLSNLFWFRFARHYLAANIAPAQAHRLVWSLILMNVIDGALWGLLTWVTLDTATPAGSILVIAVAAAMAGGSMSSLSPILPVFVAFVVPEITAVAFKVLSLHDPAYNALAVAGILFVSALLGQARNSSRAALTSIQLRFENSGLLTRLQIESQAAQRARQEAEQANTAKSKFLAAASHDLRQPIHAQNLFLSVLASSKLNSEQHEVLDNAIAASRVTGEMLDVLLDFSRIEAGVVEPQLRAFRMQPLLNKIEREFAVQADDKGLAYRSRETDLVVYSDPILVELILRNLVSNAIRYTGRGGLLVVCRKRNGQAALEVWDTGIGIATENQQEVFREFHQLNNPERDRRKGLGLGLAIADGLARTLGQRLTLSSAPQHGSMFRLSLPLADGAAPVEKPPKVQTLTLMLNVRVLVIDDDEVVRTGMLHLLREWGCICDVAETIEEALVLARTHAPDLVISDYRLRGQHTGVEAIAALRALLGIGLPALLITGDTAPERLREAQASGLHLLHKPVSISQMYQEMVEVLQPECSL